MKVYAKTSNKNRIGADTFRLKKMALDLLTDHSHYIVAEVQFLFYSSEEIRKLSVKEILNPTTFNDAQQPNIGGLYDPALGSLESNEQCTTCSLGRLYCPGHMGHIELPVPLYHPLFFETVYMLLRSSCLKCYHIAVQPRVENMFVNQSRLLRRGRYAAFRHIEELQRSNKDVPEGELKLILDSFTKEALTETDDSSTDNDSQTRNRKELRNTLVKTFISNLGMARRKCPHCARAKKVMRKDHKAKIVVVTDTKILKKDKKKNTKNISEIEGTQSFDEESENEEHSKHPAVRVSAEVVLLTASRVKEICRRLWENHREMLVELFPFLDESMLEFPTDNFFLDALGVPANRYRPISEIKDEKYEHAQTANLHRVLSSCLDVRRILGDMNKDVEENNNSTQKSGPAKKSILAMLGEAIVRLQKDVNLVIDKTTDPLLRESQPGIRQLLESKQGLFRKNMMGKRVNHACRSVISPDPNIATNEIGIPEVFAKSLTYPQPVTPWNVHELRQAVINGPNTHPGAVLVTNEDGSEIRLDPKNKTRREAVAKQLLTPSPTSSRIAVFGTKKVHRHLKNGDMVLLNRQPTLHRPSIQAHIVRVLKHEKTMRLNYMNCKAYNADFDGDEMSAHFPQSELCRAEAYHIASTDFQYLGPKDGTPLAGLMQDHIVSGVHSTIRGKFFCKEDYCNLVNSAVFDKRGPIHILPPSIIKPYRSYTGKQVLSTVILNVIPEDAVKLSFNGKAKVPEKSWIKNDTGKSSVPFMGESDVVIRQGELLVGILDKEHLGATSYGLIHCVNELYGGRVAGRLLTCLGRLFLSFLKLRGFTLGIEDILVKEKADHKRRKVIRKSLKVGTAAAMKALDLKEDVTPKELQKSMQKAHFDKDERQLRELDLSMRGQTNDIQNSVVNTIMPHGLIKMFPANNLQLMVKSGSKGSMVNTMQISCLLGQIELEGKRPPLMLSGKTLPSFYAYDASPRAGGFVSDRFLTGVRQQEYFFHCMAGREGLVDTAVKTSRSGYLQRCVIKHLEGIKVNYDSTVRDADNSVIQFHYGEDGLDVSKAGFLNAKQLPLIVENFGAIKKNGIEIGEQSKRVRRAQRKIDKWKERKINQRKTRDSPFLQYCETADVSFIEKGTKNGRKSRDIALCDSWEKMSFKQKHRFETVHYDPLLCKFWPYERGVFPEKLWELLKSYAAKNCNKDRSPVTEEEFISVMDVKVKHSLAQPGEAVGLLCAQSIGEPSTQMTLNTFHFAGRGEMNMTLGIPRLREILMSGTKMMKTPAVDVPVVEGTEARNTVKALQKWLNKVHLSEVLQDVEVATWLSLKGQRSRMFQVTFKFLPRSCYKQQFTITPQYILRCMEQQFFKNLVDTIKKSMSKVNETGQAKSRNKKDADKDEKNDTASYAEGMDDVDGRQLQAGIGIAAAADDDDDLSDVDMAPDSKDEYSRKQDKKHVDEQEYEDEENLDEEGVAIEEQEVEPGLIEDELQEDEIDHEKEIEDVKENETIDTFLRMKRQKETKEKNTDIRRNNLLQVANEIVDYKFDEKKNLWCEVTLSFPLQDNHLDLSDIIKNLAQKTVIHHVPGVSKSYLGEQQGEHGPELHLKTEGINMEEMFRHPEVLALNRLYCNNIDTVQQTYGIEAARNVIIKELQSVFGAYGIQVDYRHLSLLADYLTFEGTHKPFTRMTMASNASPLQRMTFETSMAFLLDACINAEVDDLSSPSAQITLGKNISCGTGSVDMMVPLTL